MFELIEGTVERTGTPIERLRRFGDHCIALSRLQRLSRAFFWACAGAAAALIGSAVAQINASVPPVKLLEPVVEHAADDYTVYRLRFAWRSTEKSCELVVFHDRPMTWSLKCEPR